MLRLHFLLTRPVYWFSLLAVAEGEIERLTIRDGALVVYFSSEFLGRYVNVSDVVAALGTLC